MKKAFTILLSLVLSAVVVYLGGGAMVVQCLHDGSVTLGMKGDCCQGEMGCRELKAHDQAEHQQHQQKSHNEKSRGEGRDCHAKGSCMKVTVVKLAPTTVQKQQTTCQPTVVMLPPSWGGGLLAADVSLCCRAVGLQTADESPPPLTPRERLSLIRVLII